MLPRFRAATLAPAPLARDGPGQPGTAGRPRDLRAVRQRARRGDGRRRGQAGFGNAVVHVLRDPPYGRSSTSRKGIIGKSKTASLKSPRRGRLEGGI